MPKQQVVAVGQDKNQVAHAPKPDHKACLNQLYAYSRL